MAWHVQPEKPSPIRVDRARRETMANRKNKPVAKGSKKGKKLSGKKQLSKQQTLMVPIRTTMSFGPNR